MEEKKKSNIGIILLVIVLLCAAFAGGYFVNEKGLIGGEKEAPKEEEKEEKEEKKEEAISEDTLTTMIARVDYLNTHLADVYPIDDVSKISNQKLLEIGGLKDIMLEKDHTISSDFVERNILLNIGDNVKVKHENYLCIFDKQPLYIYEDSSKGYVAQLHGHGASTVNVLGHFVSAKYDDDILKINYKNMYVPMGDINGPVATVYDAYKDGNKILEDVAWDAIDSKYETVKDKLPIVTFAFEKTDYDGYNLKSVIISK